jgi:arylsulfatase A-like enzyme
MADQPNILYVFADQMRASALGCMDDELVYTPNLDRLAAQGVLFRNAIANTPVCTPSRGSLLTGSHAWTCRCIVNDLRLPEDETSIADVLKGCGYRTGYIGKWHLDGISRHMFTPPGRRRHGFDDYWAAYNCTHDYLDPKYYLDDSPDLIREPGYDADVQTGQAIGFMERFQDQPWCLFLSWGPPHAPYRQVHPEFLNMYPPDKVELRPNAQGADRREIAGYYAHCTAIDLNMGRLMQALDRLGLAENTILVFSSDHGDMLWSQGRTKKQQPWEESIHIPLIVRWPAGLPAGQVNDTLISIADYTPTLLGLVGVPVPETMNGLDLSATLRVATDDQRPTAIPRSSTLCRPSSVFINEYVSFDQARAFQPWRGVRTERYTYARWLQGGTLLYDNLNDPYQTRNLALEPGLSSRPGHEALLEEMEAELQGWLTRLDDGFLPGDEHIHQLGQWEEWLVRQEHFYGFRTSNF